MASVRVAADGTRRRILVDGLEAAVVDATTRPTSGFRMRWIADVLDARRQAATPLDAFAEVVLLAPRGVVAGRRTGNVVLAAADRTLSVARLRARGDREVLAPAEVAVLADGAAILRDRR